MKPAPRPLRVVASLLVAVLLHAAFGQEAWAQVVRVAPTVAPVAGGASGASFNAGGSALTTGLGLNSPSASLSGSLLAPSASPSFAPSGTLDAAAAFPSASPAALSAVETAAAPAAFAPSALAALAAASAETGPQQTPSAAEPAANAETKLQSGPRTRGIASRISTRFAELRRFFAGKSAPTLEAPTPALAGGANAVAAHASDLDPAPETPALRPQSDDAVPPPSNTPPPSERGGKGKGWFGLGAIVATLIGGMLVMQLGLEAQGAAMAQLTEDAFGDFSILAQVAIFASLGSMVGQQLAQFISAKFGLTKTFYGAHLLRAISLGTMVFLLGTGMMPLPLMFLFYALNGAVTGIAATSEGTLRKFILAEQGVSQQKFRTWWQLLAEIVAVPAPMIFGALVPMLGAGWITAIYPATILAGLMIFFMLKVIPLDAARRVEARVSKPADPAPQPAPEGPKRGVWTRVKDAFKQIFNTMEEGKNFVFSNGFLKFSLLGAVIFDLMNVLIYRLITPGYGKLVAGSSGMAAVQGNLVGMFSLGGLVLAATFLLLERRAKKRAAGMTEAEKAAAERASMLRWMFMGIPALALLGVMAFQFALPFAPVVFMGVDWVPTTALAAALIPFGFFQVAASIKLNSYFAEKLPADPAKVQKAITFSGSVTTALSIMLMLSMKPLFGDLGAFNPFPWLAAALIPVGVLLFFMHRKLAAATKGEAMRLAPEEAKTSGGYAGLLLGVIAAALLLTALPFVPGAGAAIAALGVMGKFALHAGVTLALPALGWFVDKALRRRASR
jgi:hypothetical protein